MKIQKKPEPLLEVRTLLLLLASPSEICHRLALRWPALQQAYTKFRREVAEVEKMEDEIWRYPPFVTEAFGADEQVAKHCLSARDLEYELGIAREAEVV